MPAEIETQRGQALVNQSKTLTGFQWSPVRLAPPAVHAELTTLDPVSRSAEVLRYSVRITEFWLSPGGQLREWCRLSLWLWIVIGVPTVLIVPLVTFVLTSLATWVGLLLQIVEGLAIAAGWAVFVLVAFQCWQRMKPIIHDRPSDRHRH